MSKLLLKLISLILLIATLLPLAAACAEDSPPPNNNGENNEDNQGNENEGGGQAEVESNYFSLKVASKTDNTLIDFTDAEFVNGTKYLKENVTQKDGKTVLKWNAAAQLDAALPKEGSLAYVTSIRFSVYSEKATGAVIEVGFVNPQKPGGHWSAVARISIDFTGWKSFDFPANQISGYGARDNTVASFRLKANKLADGSQPSDTLYFTSIDITTESYSLNIPKNVDVNDPALYTCITENARSLFIGSEASADTSKHKSSAKTVSNDCKTALNQYREYKAEYPNEDVEHKLFGIEVIKEYWAGEQATQRFYEKVYALAKGYGMIGSDYYHSEDVLNAIIYCLEYGYKFYYGPSLIEYGAYGNWWQWEIGIPMNMIPALVIIEDKLTSEQIEKYLYVFDHYVPYPSAKGGNKIWLSRLSILSAALRKNALDLCVNVEYMNDLFDYIDNYVEDEGGFFEDGSFVQHTYYAYTSGYGGNYMGDLPQLMYYLSGSRFFPQQENVKNHYDWVIDAFRPIIYESCIMAAMAGRNVGRHQGEGSKGTVASMVLIHYYAPDDIKAKLEPTIAYFMKYFNTDFSDKVVFPMIAYAKELAAKLENTQTEQYEITKVFGMMARVVHQGPQYGACLSLSNTDIGKYEAINNENRVGWYHGDGMLQIYTDGYSFNGDFYSFANPYLMPGTTANSAERGANTYSNILFNASPYAGGAARDKYGAVGYILDYNCGKHITFMNVEESASIYAKKSYFFFDNEIVCVGSDISDKSGTDVKTVIENRYWRPAGETITLIKSDTVTPITAPETVETTLEERALHFTNMGGYVILKDYGASLIYKKASNSYNGTTGYTDEELPNNLKTNREFFELYISHGVGDKNGSPQSTRYYYAYLPEATVEQTQEYSNNPDVELLNINKAHAVLEKKLGIVAANFFENTTVSVPTEYAQYTGVKSITAQTICSVMVEKGEDGGYIISVADPTRALDGMDLTVNISGITEVVSANSSVTATVNGETVTVKVNCTGSLGQTFTLTVK